MILGSPLSPNGFYGWVGFRISFSAFGAWWAAYHTPNPPLPLCRLIHNGFGGRGYLYSFRESRSCRQSFFTLDMSTYPMKYSPIFAFAVFNNMYSWKPILSFQQILRFYLPIPLCHYHKIRSLYSGIYLTCKVVSIFSGSNIVSWDCNLHSIERMNFSFSSHFKSEPNLVSKEGKGDIRKKPWMIWSKWEAPSYKISPLRRVAKKKIYRCVRLLSR